MKAYLYIPFYMLIKINLYIFCETSTVSDERCWQNKTHIMPQNFFPHPIGFSGKLNNRQQTGPKCPVHTFRNLSQWRMKKTRTFSNADVITSKCKIFCIRMIPEMNILSSIRGKLFLRENYIKIKNKYWFSHNDNQDIRLRHHQREYYQTLLHRLLKMWTGRKDVQFNIADQLEALQRHLCIKFVSFYRVIKRSLCTLWLQYKKHAKIQYFKQNTFGM
jgi:hypothetical protein